MKNLILLAIGISVAACTQDVITANEVTTKSDTVTLRKPINQMVLSIDSLTLYSSEGDWVSVASNQILDVKSEFYHRDTLGTLTNLTSIIKRNSDSFSVKYQLYGGTKSTIEVLDTVGLRFRLKTNSLESYYDNGYLNVILYKDSIPVFQHRYPYIVSAS
jgi:hypothetical protein